MKRRRFVLITAGLAAAAGTAFGLMRFRRASEKSVAVPRRGGPEPPPPEQRDLLEDLHEYYRFLDLDDEVIWAYLADLRRYRRRVPKRVARKQFLLSTDFFAHGADETRRLRYVQLYDPYISACYNPMA